MSGKIFWSLVFILQQTSSQILESKNDREKESTMAECVSRIALMLRKLKMAMWYSAEKEDLVSEMLRRVETPVVINVVEISKARGLDTRIVNGLVILLNDVEVERVLNESLWNGETKFFIVGKKVKDVESDFKNFWKFKVINVFGLVEEEMNIVVYTFLPYEKGSCGIGKPIAVDKYVSVMGKFVNKGNTFRDPIRIKNINKCRINITVVDVKPNVMFEDEFGYNVTTHVQGIEGYLMNEVANMLNFNATFLIALDGIGWGWIRPSPHGAVGEVFTGRSDFAIGLLAPTIERYESLDLSLPYNGEECITYGVPKGAGVSTPNWITILVSEFSAITWALVLLSFIFVYLVFGLVNKLSEVKWVLTKEDIILHMFSSCLGLPVKIPVYHSFRLSLTSWFIFSFIVTVAYKSSMGSKLTVPNRDPDINTFKELLESKLQLTGYNNMLRLLQYNDSEPYIKKMVERFKVTNFDIDFAVDRIATEKKIAYVRHTTTFLYYELINPKAKGHIHVLKDCIMLYHPLIVTKKHSPFSYRLNQLISRLMESGIVKRWRSNYIYDIPPPPKPFLKLSVDNMYGVFCILCFGYILGLVAFFREITDFYFFKKGYKNILNYSANKSNNMKYTEMFLKFLKEKRT